MKAILNFSLDQKNIISKLLIEELNFSEIHIITSNDSVNIDGTDGAIYKEIYKWDSVTKYYNHISKSTIDFEKFKNYDKYKFNLMGILHRWAKTYAIKDDFYTLNDLSNRIIRYWYDYIITNGINFYIFATIPHIPHDYAIYILSKSGLLKSIAFNKFDNPFENKLLRYFISCDYSGSDIKDAYVNSDLELEDDLLFLTELNSKNFSMPKRLFVVGKKKIVSEFKMKDRFIRKYDFNSLILKILNRFQLLIKIFIDQNLKNNIKKIEHKEIDFNSNYFFFPLQWQPEATTMPRGNNFVDQLEIVRNIHSMLPLQYKLIVKEHPAYWINKPFKYLKGFEPMSTQRSKYFYNELNKLENVVIASHEIDSHQLMLKSKGCLTVTGTIALESTLAGKPTLVFGDHYYREFPEVFDGRNIDEINSFLKCSLNGQIQNSNNKEGLTILLRKIQSKSFTIKTDFDGGLITDENFDKIRFVELVRNYLKNY